MFGHVYIKDYKRSYSIALFYILNYTELKLDGYSEFFFLTFPLIHIFYLDQQSPWSIWVYSMFRYSASKMCNNTGTGRIYDHWSCYEVKSKLHTLMILFDFMLHGVKKL